jgi:hypothetical protein
MLHVFPFQNLQPKAPLAIIHLPGPLGQSQIRNKQRDDPLFGLEKQGIRVDDSIRWGLGYLRDLNF